MSSGSLLVTLALWEKEDVDVWENTTGGDGGSAEELVEFLIVADGELDMTRHNGLLFVLSAGITGEVKDLLREVLHDCGGEYAGSDTNHRCIATLFIVAVHSADGEDEISTR